MVDRGVSNGGGRRRKEECRFRVVCTGPAFLVLLMLMRRRGGEGAEVVK